MTLLSRPWTRGLVVQVRLVLSLSPFRKAHRLHRRFRPQTGGLVVSVRLVSFVSSLRAVDALDVQVPYDLTRFAGLSDTLATFERCRV
jgi:hypothetical protein